MSFLQQIVCYFLLSFPKIPSSALCEYVDDNGNVLSHKDDLTCDDEGAALEQLQLKCDGKETCEVNKGTSIYTLAVLYNKLTFHSNTTGIHA